MKNKFVPFIRWLWSKKDIDRAFHIGTLMDSNAKADSSLPTPALTQLESIDLFRFLEENGLVFPHVAGESYKLNKVEEYKWNKVIKELGKPDWKRSWLYEKLTSGLAFTLVAIVSGLLGGASTHIAELSIDAAKDKIEKMAAKDAAKETPASNPNKP